MATTMIPFCNRGSGVKTLLCCGIVPVPRWLPSMPHIVVLNIWWTTIRISISDYFLIKEFVMRTWIRIKESMWGVWIILRRRSQGRCLREIEIIRFWLRRSGPWRGWFQWNQGIRVPTFALVFRQWSGWRCLIRHRSPRWCRCKQCTPIIPILIVFWRNVILTLCIYWCNRSIFVRTLRSYTNFYSQQLSFQVWALVQLFTNW